MKAKRSIRYLAIRALAYVLGCGTVAAAPVAVDLEGAAGAAWSDAQTRQTRSVIEESPVYKDLLAEAKQLFAQPSFSRRHTTAASRGSAISAIQLNSFKLHNQRLPPRISDRFLDMSSFSCGE